MNELIHNYAVAAPASVLMIPLLARHNSPDSLPIAVVVENLAAELTCCAEVGDRRVVELVVLAVVLVVNDGLRTPVVACAFAPGGILRNTLAGGNWLIGGMIAGSVLSEELVAID